MIITKNMKLFTKAKLNMQTIVIALIVSIITISNIPSEITYAESLGKVKTISVKRQKSRLWGHKYTTGFKVRWHKVKGAQGYKIYSYGVASKKWRLIKTTKETTFKLTKLISKSKAKLKVRAYCKNSDGIITYGKFSKIVNCKAKDDVYKVNKNGELKKSFYDRYAAEQAFVLQNKMRTSAGVAKIQWSERLYEICELRAEQISKDFSHDKFDSTTKSYLKDKYGITDQFIYIREGDGNYGIPIIGTENIASGQMNYKEAMESWKKSNAHYHNFISQDHKVGAIACYMSKDSGVYWVAIFGYVDVDKVVTELKIKN